MHKIYLQARNKVLTAVTISDLNSRGVDILGAQPVVEVAIQSKCDNSYELAKVMQFIYDHYNSRPFDLGVSRKMVTLSVAQCLTVLTIQGFIHFRTETIDDFAGNKISVYRRISNCGLKDYPPEIRHYSITNDNVKIVFPGLGGSILAAEWC